MAAVPPLSFSVRSAVTVSAVSPLGGDWGLVVLRMVGEAAPRFNSSG